jgi:DNA-binding GntR family transcriptional regulator
MKPSYAGKVLGMDNWRERPEGPMYLHIAATLRQAHEPGRQLPSVPALAAEWGVAKQTARNAIEVLRSEGLVMSWQGKGTFYQQPPDRSSDDPVSRQLADILTRLENVENRLAAVEQRQSEPTRDRD